MDIVDYYSGSGLGGPLALDNYPIFSVLDLFRYSNASLAAGAGFFDYSTGPGAFFSIDGGITSLAPYETGSFNGSGRQASHWTDNMGLGIMDPTFAAGQTGVITPLDVDRKPADYQGVSRLSILPLPVSLPVGAWFVPES